MSQLPLTNHFWLTRLRRILVMCSLIAVFFVVAPTVLLYTAGYRYNFTANKLLGTGVISLDLKPNDATVYVNGTKLNKKMPIRLSNSAPGVYHVDIHKTGFHSWRQDLTVTSNQTTFIRDVQLYRNSKPIAIHPEINDIIEVHNTPRPDLLVIVRAHDTMYEIDYVDSDGTAPVVIATSSQTLRPEVLISPAGNAALVITGESTEKKLTLVNLNEPDTRTLGWISVTGTISYEWAPKKNDTLYLELNNKIISHRVGSTNNELAGVSTSSVWYIDEHSELWQARGNDLWYADSGKDRLVASTPKPISKIITINKKLAMVQHADGISVITFEDDNRVKVENHDLKQLAYFPEHDEWLAWSAWELWSIYDDGNTALLSRATEPIETVIPLDKFGVLLIAGQKGLDAFNPGYYLTERLVDVEHLNSVAVDRERRTIYFVGTVQNSQNLFKLEY